MLTITNLNKSFGGQSIFDNISFNINPGEKIGLTGRNGHGKTTLFRMIINEEHPDSGDISIPKNYKIGYVNQTLNFTKDTIIDETCFGLPDEHKDDRWRAEKILFGLGFSDHDMNLHPDLFSGGYQVRLNLAKVLISEPDLLLLDEPTNYLDVVAIRWLSSFLIQWKGELMLITHDRGFMDRVITDTVGIHRKKIKKVTGTTDKLYGQVLKEEEIFEKTRINDEKKRKEAEVFITRFRAKARLAGLVQSRIKALEKKQVLDKLDKIKTLDFSFSYEPSPAKVLMKISELTYSYDKSKKPLINKLSFNIGKHDRICVIGKNGQGKTTLLRLLADELKPDSGKITKHPDIKTGYFAQTNISCLNNSLSILDEISNAGCEKQKARNICGAMMFEGDMALKKIGIISGGEKNRVLLGKILASPANLLLLDEPTNHLDMESCDAFMAAIDNFDGAAVIVTHNEMFLHTLATRFIVFQHGGPFMFEGTYQSFLDKVGWEDEDISSSNKKNITGKEQVINKKDLRKLKADIQTRRSKALTPLKIEISHLESEIEIHENRLEQLNSKMIEASSENDGSRIAVLSKENHTIKKEIDLLYSNLDIAMTKYDDFEEEFNQQIDSIDA